MNLPSETNLTKTPYSRLNPYSAPIVECTVLTKPGSSKEILHIVCDLRNSDITYQVGASFGIIPENNDLSLDEVFKVIGSPYRNFVIETKSGTSITFEEFLRKHVNLSQVTSSHFALVQNYPKEEIRPFCETNNLASFLATFWHPSIPLQELANVLPPLLPRYYSIASSMKEVGEFVHFMVASFKYTDKRGVERESITASHLKSASHVRLFLQPNINFILPKNPTTPIILIGPGTGLASLRGFLQERKAIGAPGKNWLFTGDRQKAFDFHYGEELTAYQASGFLKLDAAFSRDSTEKVYVQDLMLKQKAELWDWIKNEDAHIYICGDAKAMAKDVQKVLHLIAETEGKMSPEEAKAFFKALRSEKRLLLDIY